MEKFELSDYKNIVVLTGAGVSVASGLGTYRGTTAVPMGKFKRPPTIHLFERDPLEIWRLFSERKDHIMKGAPNPSHVSLAKAEAAMASTSRFTLITQNVDQFHQKAGSKNVVEIHGNLMNTRCSDSSCSYEPHYDESMHTEELPICPFCQSPLRPDIVLFGEAVKLGEDQTDEIFHECDLFIAAGTSGTVFPAASFVQFAKNQGAKTVYINMEPVSNNEIHFDKNFTGKTEDILPNLFHGV